VPWRILPEVYPFSTRLRLHIQKHKLRVNKKKEDKKMDLRNVRPDASLDLRGVPCPLPPLKTMKALGKMESGQILEVVGANPVGRRSSPMLARGLGNQLLGSVKDEAGVNRFYLKKV
jgi:tRNA 2-thiouridine synthesizing protein A